MSASKYLGWSLSLAFLIVAAIGAFNYYADPCGLYHAGKKWDWIRSRPSSFDVSFIYKARAVESAQADVLFMGSSRTAEGLDPKGPTVPPNAYNLGLPSSSIYEDRRYLQHAIAAHVPQTVVFGLDWEGFAYDREVNPLFSEDRLLVQPDGAPTSTWDYEFADMGPTLFSYSILSMSWDTLRAPRDSNLKFESGFEANAPLITQHMNLAKSVLAANKKWVTIGKPTPFRSPNGKAPQMDEFSKIIDLCAKNHIRLIAFVQPLYAIEIDRCTDQWSAYSDWMKELASRMSSNPALQGELWDFSGYNSMSTEPLPLPTDKFNNMHYYWEASHYRKIVGDMVLERIFKGTGPSTFGQLVTASTVNDDLQRLQGEKEAWHEHGSRVQINPTVTQVEQK
jgi:hypothetical protein